MESWAFFNSVKEAVMRGEWEVLGNVQKVQSEMIFSCMFVDVKKEPQN